MRGHWSKVEEGGDGGSKGLRDEEERSACGRDNTLIRCSGTVERIDMEGNARLMQDSE
jgi:hypothetical protein